MHPVNELMKRPGRFEISEESLEDQRMAEMVMKYIMPKVFVVRCTHDYCRGTFVYDAYSMKFHEVHEGEVVPKYKFVFTTDSKTKEVLNVVVVKEV